MAEAKSSAHAFSVDVRGLTLSDEQQAQFTAAVQSAALAQLAQIDTRGDTVAIAFPRLPPGGTQRIWIIPRDVLEKELPAFRDTLTRFGVPE